MIGGGSDVRVSSRGLRIVRIEERQMAVYGRLVASWFCTMELLVAVLEKFGSFA